LPITIVVAPATVPAEEFVVTAELLLVELATELPPPPPQDDKPSAMEKKKKRFDIFIIKSSGKHQSLCHFLLEVEKYCQYLLR